MRGKVEQHREDIGKASEEIPSKQLLHKGVEEAALEEVTKGSRHGSGVYGEVPEGEVPKALRHGSGKELHVGEMPQKLLHW